MANSNLNNAKQAKKDEFYTQYYDIECEINAYLEYNPDTFRGKTVLLPCDDPEWSNFTLYFAQHFESLGLKKLISTSYAPASKKYKYGYQPSLFEKEDEKFDAKKTNVKGKSFILEHDITGDGKIDHEDLQWNYMEGDGDFNSEEVKALRDEADIIVTNPPFSLFREFVAWIMEADKKFLVIGNMNAVTYKEIFPLIMSNRIWLGVTNFNTGMYFYVPKGFKYASTYKFEREMNGKAVNRVPGCCWYTNLEHGRRHQPLSLMTKADILKFSKHKELKDLPDFHHYDNYDAIEVPYVDSIPRDYDGVMGVPITFIDKYCPEQFEIIGMAKRGAGDPALKSKVYTKDDYPNYSDLNATPTIFDDNGNLYNTYPRILIRKIN